MRVRIDIDPQDILDEIDVEELFMEMSDAKIKKLLIAKKLPIDIFESEEHQVAEMFAELRDALRARDLGEIEAILNAYEFPKWGSPLHCERDFTAAKVQS